MFNLKDQDKSLFQVSLDFYNYAKALAILRENVANYASPNDLKLRERVDKAMLKLLEDVEKS